jgi:5-bromo-4-chloroindolyl phosphate hydrolysis protein
LTLFFLVVFFLGVLASIIFTASSWVSFSISVVLGSSTFILPFITLNLPQRAFSTRMPTSS